MADSPKPPIAATWPGSMSVTRSGSGYGPSVRRRRPSGVRSTTVLGV
jgi:hypothetical protein